MPFLDPPPGTDPDGPGHARTRSRVRFRGSRTWADGTPHVWEVPAGSRTDGASVPAVARWLVDDRGAYDLATVTHDRMCEAAAGLWPDDPPTTRRDADELFLVMLRELGVDEPRALLMWAAVRLGGRLRGGATPRELARLAAVAPLGLVVVLLSVPPQLGRWLVAGLALLTGPRGRLALLLVALVGGFALAAAAAVLLAAGGLS